MEQEKKLKVLVIVDAQNDFISGSLANEAAQKCIPGIVKKIKEFDGDAIFLTMDTHGEDYLDTPEGKKLPVKHCIKGTEGWEFNKEVLKAAEWKEETSGCTVHHIMKPTFASVEGYKERETSIPNLSLVEEVLSVEEVGVLASGHYPTQVPMEIELCGFCTDICVISNALVLKGITYDFAEITVDSSCCAGVTPEKHEAALEVMRSCQINVK